MKKPKIKYSFSYQYLKDWLKHNQHRFPLNPSITRLRRNSFSLVFANVSNLEVIFKSNNIIEIWVWKDKNFMNDILTDFDLGEQKDKEGYFCDLCEQREYYQDRKALWEKHVFESLLKWAIKNLLPENFLCLYETEPGGSSWTKILSKDALENDKDLQNRILCKPIVN